jgi:hypothetical protein
MGSSLINGLRIQRNQREEPRMRLLADPFSLKTVNLGDYMVHLQFSRQANETQIRFGDGSKQDMPSDAVRDLIKSHKVEAVNGTDLRPVPLERNDRAWGMRIQRESPATSRQKAVEVSADVVKLVTEERGTTAEASR